MYYVWDEGSGSEQRFARFESEMAAHAYAQERGGEVLSSEQLTDGERKVLESDSWTDFGNGVEVTDWDMANEEHMMIVLDILGITAVGGWADVQQLELNSDEFWERCEELVDDEQGNEDMYATLKLIDAAAGRMTLGKFYETHRL